MNTVWAAVPTGSRAHYNSWALPQGGALCVW
jgi:hypothetical protein